MQNDPQEKARLLALLKEHAFFREKITLSSGKESEYYIDARRVTLMPEGAYLCARLIMKVIREDRVNVVGGPTLGADPIVGAVAALSFQESYPLKTFIVRKAPKAHGKQQRVEGPLLKAGERVVLIDDVATTGKAFVDALDVLRSMDLDPVRSVCLVDRREGAGEALAAKGCPLHSLFTAEDFLT